VSSAEKVFAALGLFTPKRAVWTPERAAKALGVSRASAYRYFSILSEAGFLESGAGPGYTLGPAIVELDRQIRLNDPLVQVSVDLMNDLAETTGGVILLCRLYRQRVLCIHQARGMAAPDFVSYERGRAMPLYRGATSKAILAFLPQRELTALVERDRSEIARAGLPPDGAALREALEPVRRQRLCLTDREVDPGACGAAVPLLERARVVGSLSVVLTVSARHDGKLDRAARLLVKAGHRIEAELEHLATQRPATRKGK
jgi:DNA-binding IclR family transcriptional regulator